MGKLPYTYTDSEETEDTSSSIENLKKKKKFSILKYTNGNAKKKKCTVHSISEPDESDRIKNNQRVKKLRGILKKDREYSTASEDDEDYDVVMPRPKDKYLVGRVPRVAGSRPGRGGGVAILIRKNTVCTIMIFLTRPGFIRYFDQICTGLKGVPVLQSLQAQASTSSTKRRRSMKRLSKKRSY